MDGHHFDTLARSFSTMLSRRSLGRALTGGGLAAVIGASFGALGGDARKKRRKKKQPQPLPQPAPLCTPNCIDRACGNDDCGGSCGTCGADQICHGGTCCTPESRNATCGGRCGTRTNNCGQPVTCATCATGQECLSNGSCAKVCTINEDCGGSGCSGCGNPSTEGARHCIKGDLLPLMPCISTEDCPPGSHCQDVAKVCVELCRGS
jgi:hypothetical protein